MPDHHNFPLQSQHSRHDPIATRVRQRLAARRQALGIDPRLLDMILGLPDGTIRRLEAGKSRIGPAYLFRLAAILDVTVDWFFDPAETADAQFPANLVEIDHADAPEVDEARRFLALYERVANVEVRCEIREMVRTLARPAAKQPAEAQQPIPGASLAIG